MLNVLFAEFKVMFDCKNHTTSPSGLRYLSGDSGVVDTSSRCCPHPLVGYEIQFLISLLVLLSFFLSSID